MLNRRHLRIKVLQVLYAYFQSEGTDYKNVEKELMKKFIFAMMINLMI